MARNPVRSAPTINAVKRRKTIAAAGTTKRTAGRSAKSHEHLFDNQQTLTRQTNMTTDPNKVAMTLMALRILVVLNFIDLTSTLILYEHKVISEENPVMDYLLTYGGFPYALVKLSLLYLGVAILHVYKELPMAFYATIAMTSIYLAIVAKHAQIIVTVISHK